jgi:hypothetical protein
VLRKYLIALFCAAALSAQVGNAWALARTAKTPSTIKKKVVTTVTVNGPVVKCHQWGFLQLQLTVTKTETTVNGKPAVSIKLTNLDWTPPHGEFPNHTTRSIYINAQTFPLLKGETLGLPIKAGVPDVSQFEVIAGATHTSVSWIASLKAALATAEKP